MTISSDYLCDVLIVGSGAAGLSLALRLAETHQITVLSKGPVSEGSTLYAQGGIAAVFAETDSIESHIEDTLVAGDGLCEPDTASFIAGNARQCVHWLIRQGVLFDRDNTANAQHDYHLTREGGHSQRRILHSADATGKAVETTLVNLARSHPNITLIEHSSAVDLIASDKIGLPGARRVIGAWVWDRQRKTMTACRARAVVLATGGAANVYQHSTNPDVATGDGIALAWRAGCRVANLEFNQFHPTCLFHPQARNFLLSEALRGEGAVLKRPDGTRFMPDFDRREELAPRDIVARAIDHEMKRLGAECMYLDISHRPAESIRAHFPTLYQKLLTLDLDLTRQPIPIVPAAHYTCGGVMVDRQGRTDIHGLYAIGEVSYTGLHGANRLASNSLLECLVYGWSAAEDIQRHLPELTPVANLPAWETVWLDDADEQVVIQHNLHELRLLMWDYVGIVRSSKRLERALRRITLLRGEIDRYYANFRLSDALLTLRNLVQVSELMVRCALQRRESRGLHYSLDYPEKSGDARPTILRPDSAK
ncbi:L-aspartate oxidase [Erwinia tasmaniensis]|uniref:L-aspartate oxidase n=1 Tax=Erwinia tasmaniensis (strain DSM 17950 / CFBP 7177 / CIP 109463 / NCPPB 4357 / Et1/99) TaxID=465817 RepID=B2VI37_ERWT9|nr:L-aspartate oxidase [Erwinia tasmaniensis]CAO96029.1 L-aspartate oxidase [Erwinia tasmaniensis Et1/99]